MSARIIQLRNAVQTTHRCKAVHVRSVPVIEMFWHKAAWDGVVEVFRLSGHPKAKRCYAWSFTEAQATRFVTVLEIPPVESAQTAVRAAIASEAKKPAIPN